MIRPPRPLTSRGIGPEPDAAVSFGIVPEGTDDAVLTWQVEAAAQP